MTIKIYPDEIIKLTLWQSYVYYVVGSDKEAEKILKDNNEIELSVKDALVIGLLKTIETTNLIHKFNTHITELLSNKSAFLSLLLIFIISFYFLISRKEISSFIKTIEVSVKDEISNLYMFLILFFIDFILRI
jgi:predicted PurR-regulated permease PerM